MTIMVGAPSMEQLVQALLPTGPIGIICAVLLWRDWKKDERDEERARRREELEKDRIKADTALAVAMTLLTERLNR